MSGRRPTAPLGRRRLPVIEAADAGAYRRIVVLDEDAPELRAGQFHMLAAARDGEGNERGRPWLGRAISFSETDGAGRIGFLIDPVGPGTRALARLEAGSEVAVVGPLGNGFPSPSEQRFPVIVGGGAGLAPALALSSQMTAHEQDHELILGFRSAAHAEAAIGSAGAIIATDDGSVGVEGSVMIPLGERLADSRRCEIFACGPPPMMEAVRVAASESGHQCWLALEAPMACGFGACFGCAVETRDGILRLCVDGPVLDASRLAGVSATGRVDA